METPNDKDAENVVRHVKLPQSESAMIEVIIRKIQDKFVVEGWDTKNNGISGQLLSHEIRSSRPYGDLESANAAAELIIQKYR